MDSRAQPDTSCRLCSGSLTSCFKHTVLGRYDVTYFRCAACGALQTERPYWLEEAYKQHLSDLDTGAAQRNLHNLAVAYAICRVLKLRNVIDFGGGDGLLCRLLRDYGINCFVRDKFAVASYAQGFTEPNFSLPDMVIASEVVEHFAEPRTDFEALFGQRPPAVLVTTQIYADQGSDWWYLTPRSGQHIFFYSKQSIALVAEKFGYRFTVRGCYVLFARNDLGRAWKLGLLSLLFNRIVRCLLRSMILLLPNRGVLADHRMERID